MSNASIHTLTAGQNFHHLHSLPCLSRIYTLPHSLQHMPTHAAAQAHVIWNCIFLSFSPILLSHNPLCLSLSPLSVSHMHTYVCTPRTSWQLSSPLLLCLFLYSFCNSNQKHTLLSQQGWNLCSLNRALCHHLRFTDYIYFNSQKTKQIKWI